MYFWTAIGAMALTMPQSGLDASWASVLVHAWTSGWRWGVDIIDNFGPYGFVYVQEFHPDAIALTLALNATLAGTLTVAWLTLVRDESALSQIFFSLLVLIVVATRRELFFFSFPLLVALFHFKRPPHDAIRVMLVIATALTCLVKWTFPVVGLSVLLLCDVDNISRRRRPWHLAVGLTAMGAFYAMAGQRFNDLPRLIGLTMTQTAGFADAMSLPNMPLGMMCFSGASLVGLGLVGFNLASSGRRLLSCLFFFLCCAILIFVGFKAGFVRYDALHEPTAWGALGLLLSGYWFIASTTTLGWRAAALSIAMCAVASSYYLASLQYPSRLTLAHRTLVLAPQQAVQDLIGISINWERWKTGATREWERARTAIKEAEPLPRLPGTVDSVPPIQASLLAWNSNYSPRPSSQEHQAYTQDILEADVEFFLSSRAPEYILFQPGSIDNRYPTLAEGALWPLFLTRYEPHQRLRDLLVLRRREKASRGDLLGTPKTNRAGWSQWIEVEYPSAFVSVRMRPTFFGRLAGLLFRPPIVSIETQLADGRRLQHRLPKGLAYAGFFLSPYIATSDDFLALAVGDQTKLESLRVTRFKLVNESGREYDLESVFDIDLTPVNISALRGRTHPASPPT